MALTTNSAIATSADAAAPTAAGELPSQLGDFVRRRRGGLALAAVLAVLGAAAAMAPNVAVYFTAVELFDRPAGEPIDIGRIWAIAVGVGIAVVVRAVAAGASSHVAHVTSYRILADLREALIERVHRMPLGAVTARPVGATKKVLHDDVEQLEEALAHAVPDIAAAATVPLATTIVLFVVDWRLALLALAALVLLVVVSAVGMSLANADNKAIAEHMVTINVTVMAYLQGIKVIRGFLRPDSGYDQARQAIDLSIELADRPRHTPVRWLVAVMMVATGFAVLLLVPVAGTWFVSGTIGLPTLALFLLVALGYLTPLIGLVGALATVVIRTQLGGAAIAELLAAPVLTAPTTPRRPDSFEVTFDDVTFGYDAGRPVLAGFSLALPAGAVTALVGPTGAGKSTIARLIARWWDVGSGAVRIGGVDVRDIDPAELARIVGVVQQDEYVFGISLRDNVHLARPEASDAEVLAAARSARLGEVAASLPDGWDSVLEPGGGNLSGGQRQRISIARALLKDAPIVVLDEATAALDALNERATLDAIDELLRGRTVIAIAHRLSTVVAADTIVVIDGGTVGDHGAHDELLERSARYRALWRGYTDSAGWRLEAAAAPIAPVCSAADGADPGDGLDARGSIIRPGVGAMGFGRQWRTLYGHGWEQLLHRGWWRLLLEALVRSAPVVVVYLLLRAAVDELEGGAPVTGGFVWLLTGVLAALLVVRVFAIERVNDVVWELAASSKGDLQRSLLDQTRRVPLGFFGRVDSARLQTLITNDTVMVDFQNIPQQIAGAVIAPIYSTVVLLILDWRLALAAIAGIPLFLVLTAVSDRVYHRAFRPIHAERVAATRTLLEQVRGAAVLRANPDAPVATAYRQAIERLRAASVEMSVRAAPSTALAQIAIQLGIVVLIVVGAALFDGGDVSAATLLLFLVVALTLYAPIQELLTLAGYRRNQQQIARKIGEVWDAPVLAEPPAAERVEPADSGIELRGVGFSYATAVAAATGDSEEALDDDAGGRGAATLSDVSFVVRPGTVTALVGPSGAGKTTVANLIARHWDADDGAVLIGGADVRRLGSPAVLANVTTVYQDVYLFPDTVRANVTLGRPAATDAEIAAALAAAQCADVVAGLPDGLDTVIGEGGSTLSGGERQRLSIARALLKDSPIVVLDEAVAAVDPETEARIQAALSRLMAGRTVVVIAHRLSTVVDADQIVVLDGGRVAGAGTHDELFAGCALYRQLWNAVVPASPASARLPRLR